MNRGLLGPRLLGKNILQIGRELTEIRGKEGLYPVLNISGTILYPIYLIPDTILYPVYLIQYTNLVCLLPIYFIPDTKFYPMYLTPDTILYAVYFTPHIKSDINKYRIQHCMRC